MVKAKYETLIIVRNKVHQENVVNMLGLQHDPDAKHKCFYNNAMFITVGSMLAGHRFKFIMNFVDPSSSSLPHREREYLLEWFSSSVRCRLEYGGIWFNVTTRSL